MKKMKTCWLLTPVFSVLLLAGLGLAATPGLSRSMGATGEEQAAGPASAVPPAMLALYRAAAATCPGLPWTVLAAIGTVESGNGTSTAAGVRSGANPAGAEG